MTVHTLKIPFFIQSGPAIWIPKHPNHYVYPLFHKKLTKQNKKPQKPKQKPTSPSKFFQLDEEIIKNTSLNFFECDSKCYNVSQHHLGRLSTVMIEHYNSRVLTSRIQILLLKLTFLGNDIANLIFPMCNGDNKTSLNHFGFLIISFKKLPPPPPI